MQSKAQTAILTFRKQCHSSLLSLLDISLLPSPTSIYLTISFNHSSSSCECFPDACNTIGNSCAIPTSLRVSTTTTAAAFTLPYQTLAAITVTQPMGCLDRRPQMTVLCPPNSKIHRPWMTVLPNTSSASCPDSCTKCLLPRNGKMVLLITQPTSLELNTTHQQVYPAHPTI